MRLKGVFILYFITDLYPLYFDFRVVEDVTATCKLFLSTHRLARARREPII